jgi:hypothetical protein
MMQGLRKFCLKFGKHDMYRAFNHMRLTLTTSRQNRVKMQRIIAMMKNLELKAAFQGFVEVVEGIQAQV